MIGISLHYTHTHTHKIVIHSIVYMKWHSFSLSQANGAAPLSRAVAEYFAQFNITLCQMYGMSETTGTACMNSPSE